MKFLAVLIFAVFAALPLDARAQCSDDGIGVGINAVVLAASMVGAYANDDGDIALRFGLAQDFDIDSEFALDFEGHNVMNFGRWFIAVGFDSTWFRDSCSGNPSLHVLRAGGGYTFQKSKSWLGRFYAHPAYGFPSAFGGGIGADFTRTWKRFHLGADLFLNFLSANRDDDAGFHFTFGLPMTLVTKGKTLSLILRPNIDFGPSSVNQVGGTLGLGVRL